MCFAQNRLWYQHACDLVVKAQFDRVTSIMVLIVGVLDFCPDLGLLDVFFSIDPFHVESNNVVFNASYKKNKNSAK